MPLPAKSPEQVKADRLAREAKEKASAEEKFLSSRARTSGGLQIVGLLLIAAGAWFLLVRPDIDASGTVNLQRLYVGQTSALIGAIVAATGLLLKYLN